jgi:hypothetical protein
MDEEKSIESQSVEQEDLEKCVKDDEKEVGPVQSPKDGDHAKPQKSTYCREKYRRMLRSESESEKTRRLARHRQHNNKYYQKKREKQMMERSKKPDDAPEQVLKRLKENEYKRRYRQRETPEQREKRLSHMREYKKRYRQQETPEQRERRLRNMREYSKKTRQRETPEQRESRLRNMREYMKRFWAPKSTENSSATAEKVVNSDGKSCGSSTNSSLSDADQPTTSNNEETSPSPQVYFVEPVDKCPQCHSILPIQGLTYNCRTGDFTAFCDHCSSQTVMILP